MPACRHCTRKVSIMEDVKTGIHNAVETYSDFNVAVHLSYYDPYDYHSFAEASGQILALEPDGVMFAPTVPQYTKPFTDELTQHNIPYIYIDSNIKESPPSPSTGRTRTRADILPPCMLMLLAGRKRAGNRHLPQDK